MGTFILASIGFVVLLIVVAIVVTSGKRRVRRKPAQPADDPTGYTPGVWLLGGGESAKPGKDHHGSSHGGHNGDGGDAGGKGGGN